MIKYENKNCNSNVDCYEILSDSIKVIFKGSSRLYSYSYNVAGKNHVENLKLLAQRGYGLNAYINHYVRNLYDK